MGDSWLTVAPPPFLEAPWAELPVSDNAGSTGSSTEAANCLAPKARLNLQFHFCSKVISAPSPMSVFNNTYSSHSTK